MIKNILLTLVAVLSFLTASAQELTVKSFTPTTDAIARTRNVMGTDGNVCAAVVVRIPTAEATFDGGFILGRTPYKNGEYILDMQTGAAQMRVSVPGYNTIDVKFRDYIGSTLQSKTTYLLTINMPQAAAAQKKQTLNIKVTPSDAMVLIDGVEVEEPSLSLTIGTHRYNVAAKGYHSQEGTVEIKESAPSKLIVELDRKQTTTASQANNQTTSQTVTQQQNAVVTTTTVQETEEDSRVYDVVEQMPSFPGGQSAMMQFLSQNLKYPVEAEKNGIQGRVIVSFVVDKNGAVRDAKINKSVDPLLDKETLRLVSIMPAWTPGKQNGKPVNVRYVVPVNFRCQ